MRGKPNFRALIQHAGLNKVKNSPKRRIQNVALKALQSGDNARTAATAKATATFNGARSRKLWSTKSSILFTGWKPLFAARNATHGAAGGLSLIHHLQSLQIRQQTTERMRRKVRQAFFAAAKAHEQLLVAASKALERPSASVMPTCTACKPGSTQSTLGSVEGSAESSAETAGSAPTATVAATSQKDGGPVWTHSDVTATASLYLDKMQHTLERAKRYYSSMPFDQRWDDIRSSLAMLGRTSHGNKVTPYHDSAEAFVQMWAAIDRASKRVHWQTYICKDDHVGQTTMRRLVEAHRRGCDTELLYDCGGNISGRAKLTDELKQCGASVIPYRPFFRSILTYLFRGLDWRRSPGLRNHRKILLVDGDQGFCGGLNIGNEYCGKEAGGSGKFRDTHCGVVGPAAVHLGEVYQDTKQPQPWKYGWRRWRQIATQQIRRRVNQGRMRVERNELYRDFQSEREQTGKRLQDMPSASMKVMRKRWKFQKSQLQTLMQWSQSSRSKEVSADRAIDEDLDAQAELKAAASMIESVPPLARESIALERCRSVGPGATSTTTPAYPSPCPAVSPDVGSTGAACEDSSKAAAKSGYGDGTLKSAMRRRMLAARREALLRATDLPHKRAYTDMLLRLPILDSEPVPEAEIYLQHRKPLTQILSCNPRYRDFSIQYAFWQVTRKCHRRIWITTPYYLPTRKLFKALVQAARRGVDVRLLAGSSETTDPWFMWHASNYITEQLLGAGVRIYEFKGREIMHAKTVVVDSVWSCIGSYNWDLMSNRNLEVCLCHLDLVMAREMETQFLKDAAQSVEVHLDTHRQRSRWLRFTSWLFYNSVFLLDRITFHTFSNEDVVDKPGIPRA